MNNMNYTELIEALRFCATDGDCHDCPIADCGGTMGDGLYLKAADAIKTLQNEVMLYRAIGSVEEVTSMKEWMDMSINDIRKNTLEFIRQMREVVAEHEADSKKRKRRT